MALVPTLALSLSKMHTKSNFDLTLNSAVTMTRRGPSLSAEQSLPRYLPFYATMLSTPVYSNISLPVSPFFLSVTRCDDKTAPQRQQNEESCKACLYTGMATCTGLSLYFMKMALEESTKSQKSQKPFLLTMSAAWAVAGAYRWHLG